MFGEMCDILCSMKIKFVKEDFWIGLYWKKNTEVPDDCDYQTKWYLCIIPCFPICWSTYKMLPVEMIEYNRRQKKYSGHDSR